MRYVNDISVSAVNVCHTPANIFAAQLSKQHMVLVLAVDTEDRLADNRKQGKTTSRDTYLINEYKQLPGALLMPVLRSNTVDLACVWRGSDTFQPKSFTLINGAISSN